LVYSVSQKNNPLRFSDIFPQRLGIFSPNFTHLLHVPIYARLQVFIRLPPTVTKLCHVKRDHLVHIMMLIMSVIGRNAPVQTFAKVVDSLISFVDRCLRQVIPDLLQCILALGWFLALTEVCEMLEASHPTHGSRVG